MRHKTKSRTQLSQIPEKRAEALCDHAKAHVNDIY